jgi:hypothetical protein
MAFVALTGPYVASTEFKRVIDYIVKEPWVSPSLGTSLSIDDVVVQIFQFKAGLELEDLVASVQRAYGRFIDEMSIEFNQIEEREGELLHEELHDPKSALEFLKSQYHSSWRNEKDFCWIAKDMIDVRREYAKLSVRPI